MNYIKTIRTVTLCALWVLASVSCKQETPAAPGKKVFPWYIYKEGSSFKELEPVKEIIHSISIFGNPPGSFIDECHRNQIEVYKAVGGSEDNINTAEKIEALVNEYVKDCTTYGYDGIDLDFEHLDPEFQGTYSQFLELASRKLHAAGKK